MDPLMLATLQINKLKDHDREKEKAIQALEVRVQKLENENKELFLLLDLQKQKNAQLSERLQEFEPRRRQEVNKQEISIKQLQSIIRQLEKKEKGLMQQAQNIKKPSFDQKVIGNEVEATKNELTSWERISHHPQHSQKKYFSFQRINQVSASIICKGTGHKWHNFVNIHDILPNQIIKYSVKICKTVRNYIIIGFCADKDLINFYNYKNSETRYYYCYDDGYLWDGSSLKGLAMGSREGDVIVCIVDTKSWNMQWLKKGEKFAECIIPADLRSKNLYFSVLLCSNGDRVELLGQE